MYFLHVHYNIICGVKKDFYLFYYKNNKKKSNVYSSLTSLTILKLLLLNNFNLFASNLGVQQIQDLCIKFNYNSI